LLTNLSTKSDQAHTAGVVNGNINTAPTCADILNGGSTAVGIAVGIGILADGGPLQVGGYASVDRNGPVALGNSACLNLAMVDDAGGDLPPGN
jgi:hypothetical protein